MSASRSPTRRSVYSFHHDAGRAARHRRAGRGRASAARSPARPAPRRISRMPGSPASPPTWSPRYGSASTIRRTLGNNETGGACRRADLARLHGVRAEEPAGADLPAAAGRDHRVLGQWFRHGRATRSSRARCRAPPADRRRASGAAPAEDGSDAPRERRHGQCIARGRQQPGRALLAAASSAIERSHVRRIRCPQRPDQAVRRTAEEASLTGMSQGPACGTERPRRRSRISGMMPPRRRS